MGSGSRLDLIRQTAGAVSRAIELLIGNKWHAGFLDAHRPPGACRIRLSGSVVLMAIDGLYFIRPRRLRLILNYLRDLGPMAVTRKALSRLRERDRNRKYVVAGFGELLEGQAAVAETGETVAFLGTCHPAASERVVVDGRLIWPISQNGLPALEPGRLPAVSFCNSATTILDLGALSAGAA